MDTIQTIFAVFVAGALILGAGCATTTDYDLTAGEETPAASGEVKIKEDDNNNLRLDVEVDHLPNPGNLAAGLNTYVVWLEPTGADRMVNLGQLEIDEDDRTGKLEATTPYRNFNIYITAEETGQPSQPSDRMIMRRQIDYQI
ncbi:MAG: hypothetical protein ACLFVJ_11510 [Persicimonas sp.]